MTGPDRTGEVAPGQRWISNTEPELGLGIVETTADRRLVISFPAAAEQRTYALDNAPLTRVVYEVGEVVATNEGDRYTIAGSHERDGRLIYLGADSDGAEVDIDELELDCFVQFSRPQDRLFAGQIDKNSQFELRSETLSHRHRHEGSPAFGLLGPRVQLLPHQFYIASRVGERHAPRVLLADEVGLGKTIESGLVIHQQLATGHAARVLILVPENLVLQWLVEMLRRFNLRFTVLDEPRCDELAASGFSNPFESAQLCLCSLGLALAADRQEQMLAAGWDLLVVDEAHHLGWSEAGPGPAYRAVEALAARIPGLLLLTATPEQLGADAHFARLRLLDPDRYPSLAAFREAEERLAPLARLVERLDAWGAGDAAPEARELAGWVAEYLGPDAGAELEDALAGPDPVLADSVRERLLERLLDCHGTGRVLFRNTRAAVGGFAPRRLHAHPLSVPGGTPGEGGPPALFPEDGLGEAWPSIDPRVGWLVDLCRRRRGEKVLVIVARARSAETLEAHLRLREGLRSALFHEGMPLVARDRAAAYFAEQDEVAAQVLVCSEIGSEGRNFQMARHLVLFDLPLTPDLLEQRIGRLDRLGQRHPVEIHVPYLEGTPQAALLRWYDEGMDAFSGPVPAAGVLHAELADELNACLRSEPGQAARLDALVATTRARADELGQRLAAGRDRLLERSSHRPEQAAAVVAGIAAATHELELMDYAERLFDELGLAQERHSAHTLTLRPSERMSVDGLPGLSEDGLTVTFSRARALAREDLGFLTWEHPVLRAAMDMVCDSPFGNTAFCTLALPSVKPGLLVLEALFVVHCPAPRGLRLARFLPSSVLRIVVDGDGNDLSPVFAPGQFNRLASRVPAGRAREFLRHVRGQIGDLIRRGEELAAAAQAPLLADGRTRAEVHFRQERERLVDLARVNPAIRPEEIAALEEAGRAAASYLGAAGIKLDALRVGVTS